MSTLLHILKCEAANRPEKDRKESSYDEDDEPEAESTRCELLRFPPWTAGRRGGRLHVEEDLFLGHSEGDRDEVKGGR